MIHKASLPTLALYLILFFEVGLCAEQNIPPALKLANVYSENIELSDYLISEKLDGVRAYWDGKQLISRQGIRFEAPQWFSKDFGELPLDGELWIARGQFDLLSGIVRQKSKDKNRWQKVSYRVFDLPKDPGDFLTRYKKLTLIVEESVSRYLYLVEQWPVVNKHQLMSQLDKVVAAGGEGLMLQRKDALYEGRRSKDLIKLKKWADAEARVIRHLPGKGKYSGLMGAILVETRQGIQFRIGTGFTDQQRQFPPALGSIITYKYYGTSSKGKPRFASFLRLR